MEFRGTVSYGTTVRLSARCARAVGGARELVDGMSLKMPSILPPKRDVALALLDRASVFIHFDPRSEEVMVPSWLKKQAQLVLQVGRNMAVRIPDLEVEEEAVACTLSFNRSPHYCYVPWRFVYALVGEDGRGMVWPDDIPPEVSAASLAQSGPRLRSIAGGQGASKQSGEGKRNDRDRESDGGEFDAARGQPHIGALMEPSSASGEVVRPGVSPKKVAEGQVAAGPAGGESRSHVDESVGQLRASERPYLRLVR